MGETTPSNEDMAALGRELEALVPAAERFGAAMTHALASAALKGGDLEESLKRIALSLSNQALANALKPIESTVGSLAGGLAEAAAGALGGLWGGTSQTAASSIVNVAISTPDAASFRQAESQVTATLARAVMRGQRGL